MHRPKTGKPPIGESAQEVVEALRDPERTRSDPQGMYTGTPKEKKETPVQDADDL